MSPKSCTFESLDECLHAAGADSGAAEAHGVVCGAVAAGGRSSPDLWLEHLLGEGNTLSVAAQDCSELLQRMQNGILEQFNDDAFGFSVLLPADNTSLATRTRALGEWCEGFLYGLALGGVREGAGTPETVSEVMRDLFDISHAGFVTEAPSEDDEAAYAEIVEYLRVSALLIYQELQVMAPAPPGLQ